MINIAREIKMRLIWISICFSITISCSYFFSFELLFLLVKPLLILDQISDGLFSNCFPKAAITGWLTKGTVTPSFKITFLSTQLTESLNTYLMISVVSSIFFCIPYVTYQIWCFLVPSLSKTQRLLLNHKCVLNVFALTVTIYALFVSILPNIWYFLYQFHLTSSHIFVIELHPKILDFLVLNLRIIFAVIICSQCVIWFVWLIESQIVHTPFLIEHRKLLWFGSILLSALVTPPDLLYQFFTFMFFAIVLECCILYSILNFHYSKKKCDSRKNV
jgi:Sec-independent protein secretion pathway component TatC